MRNLNYDIVAEIRFFPENEGGRKSSTPATFFGCPMVIGNKKFDCRILLSEIGPVNPGDTVTVPIKFLDTKSVLKLLNVGDSFKLWEISVIAEGKILRIC